MTTTHDDHLDRCDNCGRFGWHTTGRCPNAVYPDLPVPAGTTADDWVIDYSGDGCRALEWSRHDAAGIGVAVDGWQTVDGEITRSVSLYDTESKELTAAGARQLAAALLDAADELERLR